MSRTEARRWLVLGLAAFLLRAGVSVLTQYKPIFPGYYYHDAVFGEKLAAQMADAWSRGRSFQTRYSPPQRIHAALLALPYLVIGPKPLGGKLINAALGALGVVVLGLALSAAFTRESGFLAASAAALWPSHVFYTSQNFKESPTFAFAYAGLYLSLLLLTDAESRGPKIYARTAAFLLAAVALGFVRSYLLLVLCGAAALGSLAALARRDRAPGPRLLLAAALVAPALYLPLSNLLFKEVLASPSGMEADGGEAGYSRPIKDEHGVRQRPFTPRGLAEFRRLRQEADRAYASSQSREIGTQIYSNENFDSWLDVALFLPKAAGTVLFMPLPGLYSMDGKIGRWFAACENVFLLAISALAVLSIRRARVTPGRIVVLAFFLAMAGGSALLEFDLGSASRHKLLYFPMLFPYAAEEMLGRRRE